MQILTYSFVQIAAFLLLLVRICHSALTYTHKTPHICKLPPNISFEERRQLEAIAVKGLLAMKGDFKGDYFPLHGSKSYGPKPSGMSSEKEEYLNIASKSYLALHSSIEHNLNHC